jgi:hypothetical protein
MDTKLNHHHINNNFINQALRYKLGSFLSNINFINISLSINLNQKDIYNINPLFMIMELDLKMDYLHL